MVILLMNASQKEQLFSNIAEAMEGVPERIKVRQLVHFYKADPDYGCGVAQKLGLEMERFNGWQRLSWQNWSKKPVNKTI